MKEGGNIHYGTAANLSNCRLMTASTTTTMMMMATTTSATAVVDTKAQSSPQYNKQYRQLLIAALRPTSQNALVESLSSSLYPSEADIYPSTIPFMNDNNMDITLPNQSNDNGDNNDDEDYILWGPAVVEVDFHEEDDKEGTDDKNLQVGQMVITTQQLVFWMMNKAVQSNSDTDDSSTKQNNTLDEDEDCNYEYDLRVDATCIDLHALMSSSANHHINYDEHDQFQDVDDDDTENDDENNNNNNSNDINKNADNDDDGSGGGVYIQLSDGDDHEEDDDGNQMFQELTIRIIPSQQQQQPSEVATTSLLPQSPTKLHTTSTLFDAISQLISLHPIDPNNDDQDHYHNDNNTFPMNMSGDTSTTMWFGEGPVMTSQGIIEFPPPHTDIDDENDRDDDELIVAPLTLSRPDITFQDDENDESRQERQAMLERLDQLLIVPPEYEYPDDEEPQNNHHQFDDADDSDDDLL